jgi:hypothetical protein
MIRKRKVCCLLTICLKFIAVFLFFPSAVHAQPRPDFFEVEERVGYIVKNYPVFPDLPGLSYMTSFRMGKKLTGSRVWHRYYRYPYLGVDFTGGSLVNREVLGCMFGASAEMMFSQKLSDKFYLGELLGFGLSWFEKPYDKNENPQNTLMGSRIGSLPHASIGLEYYVSPFWSLWLRASLYHSSNCHYQLPNLGVNIPSASLAIRYHPNPAVIMQKEKDDFVTSKKLHFNIRLGLGINERGKSTGPTGGPKRLIYLTQLYLTKNLAPVNKLQAGFEIAYNTGVYDSIHYGDFYTTNQQLKAGSVVFFLGHEFLMGHFSLSTQGGIFIYNPFYRELAKREEIADFKENLKTLFLARLGFQYYFKDIVLYHANQLFAGIYVKTNFGQADFLDLGVGYTF